MLLRSGYETKQTIKYDNKCVANDSIMGLLGLKKEDGWTENADGELTKEVIMTKADWIKYHSEELLEGLVQSGKVIWNGRVGRIVPE